MTISELDKAIDDLKTYYNFTENAEIKVETDARSCKELVRVHVHPSDGVDIYMSKRIDTIRSANYGTTTMKGV